MYSLHENTKEITDIILKAKEKAKRESAELNDLPFTSKIEWPVNCVVGPGLEGAIACESKIGYVNGAKGALVYRGYDIFDLCAYSCFEEVSYLLLHGNLPTAEELAIFKDKLMENLNIPKTIRLLMGFPIEDMNSMAALRLGTNLMRCEFTYVDQNEFHRDPRFSISSDEDSIPMETRPMGEEHAIYEFKKQRRKKSKKFEAHLDNSIGEDSCYHLISGVCSLAAAVSRARQGKLPLTPDPELSHAGNMIYMMTGRKPTPLEERIVDVSLILHADHGMNASTFATMVVASTLSDIYLAIGSGIAALNGSLHGGANERVLHMLKEIGSVDKVEKWYNKARKEKKKIMGFGHRVYKAYDPRARVLGPLAEYLVKKDSNPEAKVLFKSACALEKLVVSDLGDKKGIFPNVDFYSGIVYSAMGIPTEMFTPLFAVSRVSGWTARASEYLENNRIFRPRAVYVGTFDEQYVPLSKR